MQASKKLIYLSIIGFMLLCLAIIVNATVVVFILYNIALAIFVVLDITHSKPKFSITRITTNKLSLYENEKIVFDIYNKDNYKFNIELFEEVPDFCFNKVIETAKGVIEPHEKKNIHYALTPKKRGIYEFGNIHIRYLTKYKLIYKHTFIKMPIKYKVYPNIKDLSKYRLMVYKGYISNVGKRVLFQKGSTMEFESLREYVSGDSYRSINWQSTATALKPIVNQYEVEKNQDVIAILDSGRYMSYEVKGYKKLDLAINSILILSDIANMTGDRSGLLLFNQNIQKYVKPGKGKGHRATMMESLYDVEYNKNTSNFKEAICYLNSVNKKRSIVIIFTEFDTMAEAEALTQMLPILAKKHLVLLFMMEKEKVKILAENKAETDQELFTKATALDILNERKQIIYNLTHKGIMCIECLPHNLTTEVINRYITIKNNY